MVIDPKKAAAEIIARSSGEKPKEPSREEPKLNKVDDREVGLEAAAEAFMTAVHSKNAKGIVQAFRSLSDQCTAYGNPETED